MEPIRNKKNVRLYRYIYTEQITLRWGWREKIIHPMWDPNPRPLAVAANALPSELIGHFHSHTGAL